MDVIEETQQLVTKPFIKKHLVTIIVVSIVIASGFVGLSVYGMSTKDRVLPGTMLGSVPIGNLNSADLGRVLDDLFFRRSNEGVEITLNTNGNAQTFTLLPQMKEDGSASILFSLDIPKEVERLIGYNTSWLSIPRGFVAIKQRFIAVSVELETMVVYEEAIKASFPEALSTLEVPVKNATIDTIEKNGDGYEYTVSKEQIGQRIPLELIISDVKNDLKTLSPLSAQIVFETVEPSVKMEDVEKLREQFGRIFSGGSITLTHTDPNKQRELSFTLYPERLSQLLAVDTANNPPITLSLSAFDEYVKDVIAPSVDIVPSDARFRIGSNKKVEEFMSAKTGVTTDVTSTASIIDEILTSRMSGNVASSTVSIVTVAVEPNISTDSVNDLGIKEILGVGYSSYKGSPVNRIKNVRFAIKEKLNGILVSPGETFSLLKALEPFTIEGGYLAELVIKGDEIIPEVGGGLCQVGSTMFRAAMNSGMPITERRNHSLVISYYNDHRNGKPGVDATIYDPAPDFKFENDTGNYILITTEMNETTQELWFTLWGTSDGRKGSYSEPTVDTWIPYGPDQLVETATLAPGEKKCQTPHTGAVARFMYTRQKADGTTEEREFVSHYRALPRVCLVGVAKTPAKTEETPVDNGETTENTNNEETVPPNPEAPVVTDPDEPIN